MMATMRAASTPSRRVTISASTMRPPAELGPRPALRLGLRRRAPVAEPGDLKRVPRRLEAMGAADLGLEGGDAGADELDHPAAAGADQVVVVLLAAVDVLVGEAPA